MWVVLGIGVLVGYQAGLVVGASKAVPAPTVATASAEEAYKLKMCEDYNALDPRGGVTGTGTLWSRPGCSLEMPPSGKATQ